MQEAIARSDYYDSGKAIRFRSRRDTTIVEFDNSNPESAELDAAVPREIFSAADPFDCMV